MSVEARLDSALAANLKHTRIFKGLTLKAVAERVGCSVSLLSKIESGKTTPSLNMLHRIVASLHTTVSALFADGEESRKIVTRGSERPSFVIDQAGSRIERLIPYDRRHLLVGTLHILAPGGGSEGAMSHEGEEVGLVVSGKLELTVDNQVFLLAAGDSFVFRSELPHAYRNPGRAKTRVVWVSTPPTF
jgi:transcriptional regulator with XRE-family HTH domain